MTIAFPITRAKPRFVTCPACQREVSRLDTGRCFCGLAGVCIQCQRFGKHKPCLERLDVVSRDPPPSRGSLADMRTFIRKSIQGSFAKP